MKSVTTGTQAVFHQGTCTHPRDAQTTKDCLSKLSEAAACCCCCFAACRVIHRWSLSLPWTSPHGHMTQASTRPLLVAIFILAGGIQQATWKYPFSMQSKLPFYGIAEQHAIQKHKPTAQGVCCCRVLTLLPARSVVHYLLMLELSNCVVVKLV